MRAAQEREQAGSSSAGARPPGAPSGTVPGASNDGFLAFSSKDKDKKKDKSKGKKRGFSVEAEKEQMKTVIAEASIASTNLANALQSVNREVERISDNPLVIQRFEVCKQLRRRVLRYVSFTLGYHYGGNSVKERWANVWSVDSPCRPRAVAGQLATRQR